MTRFLSLLLLAPLLAAKPCRIEIVDQENGWPVPLVELRTTHEQRFVSDNAGLIALDDPDLLGREVWFHVRGHGYGVAKDGFGYEGVRVTPQPGGVVRIGVERRSIAKRLGRMTGAGLFAEALRLGDKFPAESPGIFGCDSVQVAGAFWLWGDTTLPGYPLGVFHSTAALLQGGLADARPPLLPRFEHFRDPGGKPRSVAPIAGEGPTWLMAMVDLPATPVGKSDSRVATYSKIKGHLDEYEIGLCRWDEKAGVFQRSRVLWRAGEGEKPAVPRGHAFIHKDDQGQEWVYFGDPFPVLRCRATLAAWEDPAAWEKIPEPAAPRSAADGSEVKPHRGSIAWNPRRNKWLAVFTQHFGKPSAFGEIWYAEAAAPTGPWGKAVKILSHDNYTFYNPRIHHELTAATDGYILFEGTYTAEFADRPQPTPRYNYNQILYRLDLDDPRLAPARE